MTRRRLARIFWLGAAAILVAAALVSLVAVLKGGFSDTDGRILGTLASLLYCGGVALSGLALVDRRLTPSLGWLVVMASAVAFVLQLVAIWGLGNDDALGKLAVSSALVLVACVLTTTGLLLTSRPALRRLSAATGVFATLAVSLTLVPLWRDTDPGSTLAKAMATAWILAALSYLLAPVLQRWSAVGEASVGDRVLAVLDGVELVATRDPGRDLVVTDRPRGGEQLVLRRSP